MVHGLGVAQCSRVSIPEMSLRGRHCVHSAQENTKAWKLEQDINPGPPLRLSIRLESVQGSRGGWEGPQPGLA